MSKFDIQEGRYAFPYHYLPHFARDGVPMRSRGMNWGFEYLCYQRHLAERVRELRAQSVLDIGCGDGRFLGSMNDIPVRVGVDLSEAAVRFARAFHPEVEFICAPIKNVAGTFDVAVAVEVLEHIPDEAVSAFIRDVAAHVRPGGHVLFSVPTTVVPVHTKHYRHYDEKLLRCQIDASEAPLELCSMEHVFAIPGWLDVALRFTCGPLLVLELPLLNRVIWNYIWKRGRLSRSGKGRHLVAVLRRLQDGQDRGEEV